MIAVHFQGKPFNITVTQAYAPTSNAKEATVEWFYDDLQELLELTPPKICPFHYRGLECESRKSRATWLLPLSHFSRVWLCETPWTAAYQAPPSLGFSRQEHWSGLPFPSPMSESEKWKWKWKWKSLSRVRLLWDFHRIFSWVFPGKSTGVGCHCFLQELPGVTGKFGLGVQNEARQRLIEFCQENTLIVGNTLFQQHKRRLYTWTLPDGQ